MIIDIFSLYYVVYSVARAKATGNEGPRDTMRQLPFTRIALLPTFLANFDQSAPPRHQEVHHRYRSWIILMHILYILYIDYSNIYTYTHVVQYLFGVYGILRDPASVFEYSRFFLSFLEINFMTCSYWPMAQEFGHSPGCLLRRSRDPGDTGIVGSSLYRNCRGRRRVMAVMADDSFLQGTIRPWIARVTRWHERWHKSMRVRLSQVKNRRW